MRKPYVTELIGLLDKPALLRWANKIGLQGITLDKFREQALAKGKSLHEQIQRRLETGIPLDDPIQAQACESLLLGRKILAVEKVIETEWFIGRMDVMFDGPLLCDFKSSPKIYIDNVLQLVAYRMAEGACDLAVIEIPAFKMRKLTIASFTPFEELLKCLASVYQNLKAAQFEYDYKTA